MTASARLMHWVAEQHRGQKIKYSGELYFNHLQRVALIAGPVVQLGFEIGLCHDLFEDTSVTKQELRNALMSFGYKRMETDEIAACVTELTDVYTVKKFPDFSKPYRKELEATRLAGISALAQTVKYADLIDNLNWVLQYEPHKARKYLLKKQMLLIAMDKGSAQLRRKAFALIQIKLIDFL